MIYTHHHNYEYYFIKFNTNNHGNFYTLSFNIIEYNMVKFFSEKGNILKWMVIKEDYLGWNGKYESVE